MALFKPVLIIKKNILVLEFSVLHLLHSFPMSSEKTLQFTYEKKIIKQKDKKVENNFISGKKISCIHPVVFISLAFGGIFSQLRIQNCF
jgi:hypothetical protein